jgi:hypothetical protein
MDWFETLTGFRETSYADTQAKLEMRDGRLRSRVNGADYATGQLELVSLQTLRDQVAAAAPRSGRTRTRLVQGDVRRMHRDPGNAGALFQVASQFNLLEMVSPSVSPERGVTGYQGDATQGPACAIAAGAATIYRNYFVPCGDGHGQTAHRQLDGLADLGAALGRALGMPVETLWEMRNGYALATRAGLDAIGAYLAAATAEQRDGLRAALRIGVQSDVEATEAPGPDRPLVSQAFCSALPVAYSRLPSAAWEPFARLVLEAAYEATLLATVLNASRGASDVVFLTLLGGGAFGNDTRWIHDAIRRGLAIVRMQDLDVRLVSYGPPPADLSALIEELNG